MNARQRKLAMCCGLCSVAYLINRFFPLPDFLRGFVLGLAIVFLILALLPEETSEKLKKWKIQWITKISR